MDDGRWCLVPMEEHPQDGGAMWRNGRTLGYSPDLNECVEQAERRSEAQ